MEKIILTRKELYDLVWSKPVAVLIRKYDIKNSEFRKILTEMNILTPTKEEALSRMRRGFVFLECCRHKRKENKIPKQRATLQGFFF